MEVRRSVFHFLIIFAVRQLPFLGTICRLVGHFPVFFRSNDENSFGVDKDEQAKIMIKVRMFDSMLVRHTIDEFGDRSTFRGKMC